MYYAVNRDYIHRIIMERTYIYQLIDWPRFSWDTGKVNNVLSQIRHRQGRLIGRMEGLGFSLQSEASLQTITLDVL